MNSKASLTPSLKRAQLFHQRVGEASVGCGASTLFLTGLFCAAMDCGEASPPMVFAVAVERAA